MADSPQLTEATVQRIAPDNQVFQTARSKIKAFKTCHASPDKTWLMATYSGTEGLYELHVDLLIPSNPVWDCSCPSSKQPCKHVLGLLLQWINKPGAFGTKEPTAQMKAARGKREKWIAEREQEIRQQPAEAAEDETTRRHRHQAQREGLRLLEQVLADLIASGQWDGSVQRGRLQDVMGRLNDAWLPRAALLVGELLGQVGKHPALMLDRLAVAWALARELGAFLERRLAEADLAIPGEMAEWLTDALRMDELHAMGCFRSDLELLELAFDRWVDAGTDRRFETSHLIDLADGRLYQAWTVRPESRKKDLPGQPSYDEVVRLREAAIYPGGLTRRIRWEPSAQTARPITPADHRAVLRHARDDFALVRDEFRRQCMSPLASHETLALLRCAGVGWVGKGNQRELVLEDAAEERYICRDRPQPPAYPAVEALARAAPHAHGQIVVLARLMLRPGQHRILAQPLALLDEKTHLRLTV
jgi:hypothetical protein